MQLNQKYGSITYIILHQRYSCVQIIRSEIRIAATISTCAANRYPSTRRQPARGLARTQTQKPGVRVFSISIWLYLPSSKNSHMGHNGISSFLGKSHKIIKLNGQLFNLTWSTVSLPDLESAQVKMPSTRQTWRRDILQTLIFYKHNFEHIGKSILYMYPYA